MIAVTAFSAVASDCAFANRQNDPSHSEIAEKVREILSSFWGWGRSDYNPSFNSDEGGNDQQSNAQSADQNGGDNHPSGKRPNGQAHGYGHNNGNGRGNGRGHGSGNNSSSTNSGNGGLGSALNLLVGGEPEPDPTDPPPPDTPPNDTIPPTTVTNDPFADIANSGEPSNDSQTGTISTTNVPYGSVPPIGDDAASVDYLLEKLMADARKAAHVRGELLEMSDRQKREYHKYARRLAKTLGNLTQEQQNLVFYGVK